MSPHERPEMGEVPRVEELSIEEQIGQTLCFGWQDAADGDSRSANAHARELAERFHVGSVVLMGRNAGPPEETRALIQELQSLSRVPLFIAVDQEGGVVNRFRRPESPLHEFPGNMALGACGMEEGTRLAEAQARAQARELRALGVNWNFAPVVDVNNNPDNPIIGVRSYGEDPALVARLGSAAVRGYQSEELLACAKHFPGHGDTSVDSHVALPTILGDRARLEAVELPPFRAVIAAGVRAIMTTHILFPALDADRPATLSGAVLTGLLRKELGFEGIVITDCLEMDAIGKSVGTARGAVEALKAGADVVLACHTLETQRETVAAILRAVESGELPRERLQQAVLRVLAAKRRFLVRQKEAAGAPWEAPEHDALEQEIARKSVTVVRNAGGVPLLRTGRVLLISMHPAVHVLHDILRPRVGDQDVVELGPHSPLDPLPIQNVEQYGAAVALTCPREAWSAQPIDQEKQAAMVRTLHGALGKRLVVVAMREPYDLQRFTEVENYLCTYGTRRCSLAALAAALAGEYQPSGRLPVTIPDSR